MPATYEPIATQTLGSTSSSVTFSSIPATYTDLVLVFIGSTTSTGANFLIRFNGDTTSNYSATALSNYLNTTESSRQSSVTSYRGNPASGLDTISTIITQVMNYANTTTFKTILTRAGNAGQGVDAAVGLWRKTPEAINSINIFPSSSTFIVGSTFTLYGIKAA